MRAFRLSLVLVFLGLPLAWAHESEHRLTGSSTSVATGEDVKHHEITYANGHFEPSRLEVQPRDHVMFINRSHDDVWPASNIHPTHEIYPEFDPESPLPPGKSWSFVFDRPGDWRYHNHLKSDQNKDLFLLLGLEPVSKRKIPYSAIRFNWVIWH